MQIVRVSHEQARHVARLRDAARLEVAEGDVTLWVRAAESDKSLDRLLAGLGGERFELIDGELLVPLDARVPIGRLPPLRWIAIRTWAGISLPVAALSGQLDLKQVWSTAAPTIGYPGCSAYLANDASIGEGGLTSRLLMRLVRGGDQRQPTALITEWQRWFDYAISAPEIRLRPLAFASSADGRALLYGSPLPPILGQFYVVDKAIATPCGWSITPTVSSAVIRKVLGLAEHEWALFALDGTFERLAGEHFVRASRGAVRASAHGEAHV